MRTLFPSRSRIKLPPPNSWVYPSSNDRVGRLSRRAADALQKKREIGEQTKKKKKKKKKAEGNSVLTISPLSLLTPLRPSSN
ncbi:hypothetical protein BHE74_00008843 [Ensete ventricosum]|nr:hypothetical protein BHE74_00008843 [Ensete ventricosum]